MYKQFENRERKTLEKGRKGDVTRSQMRKRERGKNYTFLLLLHVGKLGGSSSRTRQV
jgi:hypothetical protein